MLFGSMYISSAAVPGMCCAHLTDTDFNGSNGSKSDQSAKAMHELRLKCYVMQVL